MTHSTVTMARLFGYGKTLPLKQETTSTSAILSEQLRRLQWPESTLERK
jgi:hypothetical protein